MNSPLSSFGLALAIGLQVGLLSSSTCFAGSKTATKTSADSIKTLEQSSQTIAAGQPSLAKAYFAGGCFWCMEPPFEALDGVMTVLSGYIDGKKKNPTYEQVSSGTTGYTEAIEVTFNPEKVDYQKLLKVFWRQINPTTPDRQFVDVGRQYRPGIYFVDESQESLAKSSRDQLASSKRFEKPIKVEIKPATQFYPAEDYHQDYYKKNPIRYKYYRFRSGRDQYLERVWGK